MLGVVFSTGMGPVNDGQLEVSPDLSHSLAASVQVAYWLLYVLLHGAVVVVETAHLALNPYRSFQNAVNPQLSDDAFSEKNYS